MQHTGRVPRPALVTCCVALALAVGACAPGPGDSGEASPSPPSSPTIKTGPSGGLASAAAGTDVTAGDVTLTVTVPGGAPQDARVRASADARAGTAEIALDLTGTREARPTLTLTSGGELVPHADGSVTILDDGGSPVGGLTPPTGGAALVRVDERSVRVTAPAGTGAAASRPPATTATTSTTTTTTTLGTSAVASTAWGEREGGRSLAVEPTAWARAAGEAGWTLAWAELVAADPSLDVATMRDQLVCHGVGARQKATWNLEPWRPDVGLVAVLAARCNPTR